MFIGLLTALIGDLATHMGCCMGLLPSVTAITFVALGTSLPDTFASKSAAVHEPYADASIVNVTGSNSVNVFLGLGLPWAAASMYWSLHASQEEEVWRARCVRFLDTISSEATWLSPSSLPLFLPWLFPPTPPSPSHRYNSESWYSSEMDVGFAVPAGDLGYSVTVFVLVSMLCMLTLVLRRWLSPSASSFVPLAHVNSILPPSLFRHPLLHSTFN